MLATIRCSDCGPVSFERSSIPELIQAGREHGETHQKTTFRVLARYADGTSEFLPDAHHYRQHAEVQASFLNRASVHDGSRDRYVVREA